MRYRGTYRGGPPSHTAHAERARAATGGFHTHAALCNDERPQIAVSLAELAENTTGVLDEAKDATIAVLSEDQVVPADAYEALLDRLDDLDLVDIVRSRSGETRSPVDLDDLARP